jgi:hypothetical protein
MPKAVSSGLMRYATLFLLILLMLAGVPLASGTGEMMICPSCPPGHAPMIFSICLGVLTAVLGLYLAILGRAMIPMNRHSRIVVATRLLRPPRAL